MRFAFACLLAIAACGNSSGGGGDDGDDADTPPPYVPPYAECSGGAMPPPPAGSLCLNSPTNPPGTLPLAVIEHSFEQYMGVDAIHIRLVFDPKFVDNTYGTNVIGWERDHKFGDLVGSDHAEVKVFDASGNLEFHFKLDYITADDTAPCGFRCLGVDGGEGAMIVGDRAAILGYSSSLDQNINERGYCAFITDSPATDANCTPNPAAPDWDFRVVYDVWIAVSAFTPEAFGSAYMSFVHASPSKAATNTVEVEPAECPCTEIDPNDCAPPPGGDCTSNEDCGASEFCTDDGKCVPILT